MNQHKPSQRLRHPPTDDRSKLHHRGLIDITGNDGRLNAAPLAYGVETPDEMVSHAKHALEKAGVTVEQAIADDVRSFDEQQGDKFSESNLTHRIDVYMHLLPRAEGETDWICTDRMSERDGLGMVPMWVTPEQWDKHHDIIKSEVEAAINSYPLNRSEVMAELAALNPSQAGVFKHEKKRRRITQKQWLNRVMRHLGMTKDAS